MSSIEIVCPHCGARFKGDESHMGLTGECDQCGKDFEISVSMPAGVLPPPLVPPREDLDPSNPQEPANAVVEEGNLDATMAAPAPKSAEEIRQAEELVPAEWDVGDVILDLYEVKQLDEQKGIDFAEGGFGRVYRVHHRGWDMDLAVKSPKAGTFETDEQKADFVNECETWINLGLHPHTVSCHYVRTLGGIPRVFAEYVEGGTLSEWIKDRRLYESGHDEALKRILDIAIQFAWGLEYAHEKGLVHQDVKPLNVMMTNDGTAKVTDFGLAKARALGESMASQDRHAGQSMIVPGAGSYTPEYASPEQVNGEELTRRTDIWSWAISVYEMFVGGLYWGSGMVVPSQLAEYPDIDAEIDTCVPPMPEALTQLLRECLMRDTAGRPQSMQAAAARVAEIYGQSIGGDYPRQQPKAPELLADGLNNRALSMVDMGRTVEAEAAWKQALASDPHHPESTFNYGSLLWRDAKVTDVVLLAQLNEVAKSVHDHWQMQYYAGLVHLARRDGVSAVRELERSAKSTDDEMVQNSLLEAKHLAESRPQHAFYFDRPKTSSVVGVKICMSRDGRLILMTVNTSLELWETASGRRIRSCEGHTRAITSVAISSDAQYAVSASDDGTMRLWDLATGHCLRSMEGQEYSRTFVALSADGSRILSGNFDAVCLWESTTGRCMRRFEREKGPVGAVALSAGGQWALSGGPDLCLWETATGRCVCVFEGHTGDVNSVVLSADNDHALSGSEDRTLRLWEVATGRCVRVFQGHADAVNSIALSADGQWALSGGDDATLRLWEVTTGRCARTFEKHDVGVSAVSLSADGRWGVSAACDTLRRWEICARDYQQCASLLVPTAICRPVSSVEVADISTELNRFMHALVEAESAGLLSQALDAARQARALPGCNRRPEVMDSLQRLAKSCARRRLVGAWHTCTLAGHQGGVNAVCLSSDARWALSGSEDATVRLWDTTAGRCIHSLEGHTRGVKSVCLSDDGSLALSGSLDGTLRAWDLLDGQSTRVFRGHAGSVESVCLSANGRWALSGSYDGTLRLWDLTSSRCARRFEGHKGIVRRVCLSADNRFALSLGDHDDPFRLWDVATGRCLDVSEKQDTMVNTLCLSQDSRWFLGGDVKGVIRMWDVATGKPLCDFEGHTAAVEALCLTVDKRWALSGSQDGTLRLWDLEEGSSVRTFEGHTSTVTAVSMSGDARWALSGSEDYSIRLWYLDWEYEFPGWSKWDDGALSYLLSFLTLRTPGAGPLSSAATESNPRCQLGLTRHETPLWTETDFRRLIRTLQYAGYGWLRAEGVHTKLEEIARSWEGAPSRI